MIELSIILISMKNNLFQSENRSIFYTDKSKINFHRRARELPCCWHGWKLFHKPLIYIINLYSGQVNISLYLSSNYQNFTFTKKFTFLIFIFFFLKRGFIFFLNRFENKNPLILKKISLFKYSIFKYPNIHKKILTSQ